MSTQTPVPVNPALQAIAQGAEKPAQFVAAPSIPGAPESVTTIIGVPERWITLSKISDEAAGWSRETKGMEVEQGNACIVMTRVQYTQADGTISVTENLVYVPNCRLAIDLNGGGKLVHPASIDQFKKAS